MNQGEDKENEAVTTILIISVKDRARRVLLDALREGDYNLLIAETGKAGLEIWNEVSQLINLIILDNDLTDMPCQHVLNVLTGMRPIPKIIMATSDELVNYDLYHHGIRLRVIKPYHDTAALLELIKNELGRK